jgi:hypothetical protein
LMVQVGLRTSKQAQICLCQIRGSGSDVVHERDGEERGVVDPMCKITTPINGMKY